MRSALERIALMLAVTWVGAVQQPADRLAVAPPDAAPTAAQPKQDGTKPSVLAANKQAERPPPREANAAQPVNPAPQAAVTSPNFTASLCSELGRAALENELPADFFVRLIWQESRFDTRLVSRKGAKGIAQFMPDTAQSRGLADPFEPFAALRHSARWLKELRRQFGNLGLAATAYNAGPRHVDDWLHRRSQLPGETREYVKIVTGRTADEWVKLGFDAGTTDLALATDIPCNDLAVVAAPAPNPSAQQEPDPPPAQTAAPIAQVLATEPASALEREAHPPSAQSASAIVAVLAREPHPPADPSAGLYTTDVVRAWGLQLTGNWSEAAALAAYRDLQKKFPEILGDRLPFVLRGPMAGRGAAAYYRVRVTESTRERAAELCARLQRAGGECLVFRN